MLIAPPLADDHLASRLATAGCVLGQTVLDNCSMILEDYLAKIVEPVSAQPTQAMDLLLAALERHLLGLGERQPQHWCDSLRQAPVLQQADHSNLILDQEAFLNNVLFALGARRTGLSRIVTVQCSTVSCIGRRGPYAGPPFLRTRGNTLNVFGLSLRSYASASFCALPSPVRTVFVPMDGSSAVAVDDSLLGPFLGQYWAEPVECFRQMNSRLWSAIAGPHMPSILFLDDRFSSELIAGHVEAPESPIATLIFDETARKTFVDEKIKLVRESRNFAVPRDLPDHFWLRERNRLLPVSWRGKKGPVYWDGALERPLPFVLSRASVAQALRQGQLIPDRILIYFARCLLPGVAAIGGTSQQDYLKLYQSLLLNCHERIGLLSRAELCNSALPNLSRLGGAPLVEPDRDTIARIAHVGPRTDLEALLAGYLKHPLAATVGAMECARYLEDKLNVAKEGVQ